MNPIADRQLNLTRRTLLANSSRVALGGAALASLLRKDGLAGPEAASRTGGLPGLPHHPAKAKRVIYLFFSGGPSHIDMFDFHPKMREFHGTELPDSIRQGQRLTGMTSGQKSFPCVAPMFEFQKYGEHQTYVSELLPNVASIVDKISIVKTMHTEAINHDPAITYINTSTQQIGKPSMGAWVSYGLGSPNENLPSYVTMISKGKGNSQALYARLWGSGFLPSRHQGVRFRSGADPVLYLSNPDGIDREARRRMLDGIAKINGEEFERFGDPETEARIAQYEMAYRMQRSVPELMDLSGETKETVESYGQDAQKPGTFASNCLLARRMAEAGVPFIQLFHRGWDQHGSLPNQIRGQCKDTDQPAAALVKDLEQRGLLEDTLVICGGEFGRTIYSQGKLTKDNHGRDHHGRCFSMWFAGGGIRPGYEHGETDDYAYNIVKDGVHIRDLNRTMMHLLGIDAERLTVKHQGLDQSPVGVEPSRIVEEILA